MGRVKEVIEEKRGLNNPYFSFFTKWMGFRPLLFLSLFISLPFVFRLLQLQEEKKTLMTQLTYLEERISEETKQKKRLEKELHALEDPRFLEFMIMERLGVVPKGAKVIQQGKKA